MAQTYSSSPVLSKINIGGQDYFLKDADARAILDTCGDVITHNMATSISDGNGKIADAAVVKAYVDAQVGAIHQFDVVIDKDGTSEGPSVAASADTMYKLYLVPDTDAAAGSYIEWITVRSGSEGSYTYAWEKIGSTKLDLSGYLKNTATVAGVAFGDDQAISASELEAEGALNLKALAHKAEASGEVAKQDITGVKGTYTPAGTVSFALSQASTAATVSYGDLTVSGDITGDAIKGGSISVTLKDSSAVEATLSTETYTPAGNVVASATISALTSATFQKSDAGLQIEGTVSAPDINLTASAATFVTGLTGGKTATFTEGAFTPASLGDGFYTAGSAATWTGATYTAPSLGAASLSAFAVEGITASPELISGATNDYCLTFSAATTSNAVTAQGSFNAGNVNFGSFDGGSATALDLTKFNGGSKAADTFVANELQGVATASVNNVSAAALATVPVFTGAKYNLNTNSDAAIKTAGFTATNSANIVNKVEYVKSEVNTATFTPEAASLSFSQTIENGKVTGVQYNQAAANGATFYGAAGEVAVGTITVAASTVTVK